MKRLLCELLAAATGAAAAELTAHLVIRRWGAGRDEDLERRLAAVEVHLQHLPPERVS